MNVLLGIGKERECKLFPLCIKVGMWEEQGIKCISNEQSSNPDKEIEAWGDKHPRPRRHSGNATAYGPNCDNKAN